MRSRRHGPHPELLGDDPFAAPVADYAHNLLAGTSLLRLGQKPWKEATDVEAFVELGATVRGGPRQGNPGGAPVDPEALRWWERMNMAS